MKKIMVIMLTSIFLVAGCSGGSKTTSKVCTGKLNDQVEGKITLDYKEKNITKIMMSLSLTDKNIKDNLETYEKTLEATKKERENIKYDYKIDGEKITQTYEINVDKADYEELSSGGLLPQGMPFEDGKLDLDKTVKIFEDADFKCK